MIIDLTNKQIDQARQSQLMAEPGWRSVGTQYLAQHTPHEAGPGRPRSSLKAMSREAPPPRWSVMAVVIFLFSSLPPPPFGVGDSLCRYCIPRRTSSKNSPGEEKKKGWEGGGIKHLYLETFLLHRNPQLPIATRPYSSTDSPHCRPASRDNFTMCI